MLVEDEVIIAMDVSQRLETLGYEVVAHVTSGTNAIRTAAETQPDLILMDIKIQGPMDGIETAAQIRAAQDVPIIYLTAFADENTLKRARVTEAFGYLLKPFEERELHSAIEIALYKHLMEKKLRISEERYALATRAAKDGIWDWDLNTNNIYFASRWRSMLGLDEEQSCTSQPSEWLDRVHAEDKERLNLAINTHLQGLTSTLECEYRIKHRDGGYRWMLCNGLALFDQNKKPFRMAGSQSDITSRKKLEEQLIHKAMHDDLTRLPNRALFMDRLNETLKQVHNQRDKKAAVMFLDIDHFKLINDSLGHKSGDSLLVAISQRLQQSMRLGDTLSRFGGDEFAILIDSFEKADEALKVANRICETLKKPFIIDGRELFSNASIGIVFTDNNYQSADDLMRDADIAMYHSKNNGRSRFEIFRPEMHENTLHRIQIEAEIRQALRNNEFILHYQPVFLLEGRKLVGFEALIRWQHPTRGLLLPAEFISVAEQSGLIISMDGWVLNTACLQAQEWNKVGGQALKMAVNLSSLQLNNKNLVQKVRSALNNSGLAPQLLELELTETTALQNIEDTIVVMKSLRDLGVSIAIDDFGKGYSSLDYIKNLPSNTLKIDRSFINDISDSNSAVVLAMITLGHQMHLKVIAEGVETENQIRLLSKMNCDLVQGFYLGKPAPTEDVLALIAADQELQ